MNKQAIRRLLNLLKTHKIKYEHHSIIIKSDCKKELPNNIKYDVESEGLRIKINGHQEIIFFKDREQLIEQIDEERLKNSIGTIEDEIIYIPNDKEPPLIIKQLKYSWRLFKILKNISNYHDSANRKFILISEKEGLDYVGYQHDNDINSDNNHFDTIETIESQLEEQEFKSFIVNRIIMNVSSEKDISHRFSRIQIDLPLIFNNATRDYNLYKSKFSFEKFKKDLHKQKQDYLNYSQEFVSNFTQKISGLTIEMGALVFLVNRFNTELLPLGLTMLTIIAWFVFKTKSICYQKYNINYFKKKILQEWNEIKKTINDETIDNAKTEIDDKLSKTLKLLTCFQCFVTSAFILLLGISLYFLYHSYLFDI